MIETTITELIIKSVISFAVFDVVFRQAFNRFDTIAKWRVESLYSNLIPARRALDSLKSRNPDPHDFEHIVHLIESIKPLPPKSLTEWLHSQRNQNIDSQAILELRSRIKKEIETAKSFARSYSSPYLVLESARGFSMLIGLTVNAFVWSWIPFGVLFALGIVPLYVFIIFVVIALVVELTARANGKPPII
jgi:hypothetical protein